MSGDLVRAVGYIFPPGLHHLFVDDVWEGIGRATACWRYDGDVMVRHRHVMSGAAPADDTHRAAYGDGFTVENPGPDKLGGFWAHDEAIFKEWLAEAGPKAIERVRALRVSLPGGRTPEESAEAKSRFERVKSRSVFIATPVHRSCSWQYTQSLVTTVGALEKLGVHYRAFFVVNNSRLPVARNELAAEFLASGCTDMVMIDSDMRWRPNAMIRLLASDKSIVGIVGRKRTDPPAPDSDARSWCVRLLPGSTEKLVQDDMGAVEVAAVGTGMIKIDRAVLEAIAAARPEIKKPGRPHLSVGAQENYYKFFYYDNDEGGEDYTFCNDARALGHRIWVDPTVELGHCGETEFKGTFSALLTAAPLKMERAAAD